MARRPLGRAPGAGCDVVALLGDPALRELCERELRSSGFAARGFGSLAAWRESGAEDDPLCWFVSPELATELCRVIASASAPCSPVLLVSSAEQVGTALYALRAAVIGREQQQRDRQIEQRVASLTPREREVLDAVVKGCTNREIAAQLEISIRTVESHRAHLMEKLRVRSLSALFHAAMAYDLVHMAEGERAS